MVELGFVCQVVGVVVAASWAAYGLESATGLHPTVRRAAQIGLCAAAGSWVAHMLGFFR